MPKTHAARGLQIPGRDISPCVVTFPRKRFVHEKENSNQRPKRTKLIERDMKECLAN